MVIAFIKLADASHVYTYYARAKSADGDIRQIDCDSGTLTCKFSGLTSATSYETSVRACFSPETSETICGSPSLPTTARTLPKG